MSVNKKVQWNESCSASSKSCPFLSAGGGRWVSSSRWCPPSGALGAPCPPQFLLLAGHSQSRVGCCGGGKLPGAPTCLRDAEGMREAGLGTGGAVLSSTCSCLPPHKHLPAHLAASLSFTQYLPQFHGTGGR